jgi:DNA-directed RNA polymerase specialized sigma24 family protein
MVLTAEVIEGARKLRPHDVSALLRDQFPSVYRLAYALAGRWDVGRGIARFVLARSVRVMPKWKPDDDPVNWFHRYTIMMSRRSARHTIDVRKDVLVEQAMQPDNAYIAFVAALRHLEAQQREAFLLHHCERLNDRYSALAMDCSTEAAANHLKAATQALRLVAGADFDPLTKKLCDAYAHLTPEGQDVIPQINKVVFRQVNLRKWLERIVLLVELAILAALLYGGWRLYQVVLR